MYIKYLKFQIDNYLVIVNFNIRILANRRKKGKQKSKKYYIEKLWINIFLKITVELRSTT